MPKPTDGNTLRTDGPARFVQLPHPGREHDAGANGIRPWRRASFPHARTFLRSEARFRSAPKARERTGPVAYWGEWEGEARVVEEFESLAGVPRWLCEPNLSGAAPRQGPAQNTDPFVWGDAITYTACRQNRNRKLRVLGRGSVILFGSSLGGEFVLDTVLVVAGYVDHTIDNYRKQLRGVASSADYRMTLDPWYQHVFGMQFRFYVGATPQAPVDGMFSFVPCRPAGAADRAFARPSIELSGYVNPNVRMQARSSDDLDAGERRRLWKMVVEQVGSSDLYMATQLMLP